MIETGGLSCAFNSRYILFDVGRFYNHDQRLQIEGFHVEMCISTICKISEYLTTLDLHAGWS